MMRLERETVIIFNEAEPDAIITTRSAIVRGRLEKRGWKFTETPKGSGLYKATGRKSACVPRNTAKRSLSPEAKLNASLRMKNRHSKSELAAS